MKAAAETPQMAKAPQRIRLPEDAADAKPIRR